MKARLRARPRQHNPQHFPNVRTGPAPFYTTDPHGCAQHTGKKFSCPAGRQQRAGVPVLARGGRNAGSGSGLCMVDIVRDGGRWSSRTGGPRTQAPAYCHAHRDPAGCASSIRSSCPGSVAAGAGHLRLRYHDQEQERWAPVPLDDRVQQAITGQQRPTPRRLAAFPYPGQRGRREAGRQHLPGRAREAGRKIPDHHTQPGLAPSHHPGRPTVIKTTRWAAARNHHRRRQPGYAVTQILRRRWDLNAYGQGSGSWPR